MNYAAIQAPDGTLRKVRLEAPNSRTKLEASMQPGEVVVSGPMADGAVLGDPLRFVGGQFVVDEKHQAALSLIESERARRENALIDLAKAKTQDAEVREHLESMRVDAEVLRGRP